MANPTIRSGDNSPAVKEWQTILNKNGAKLTVDGDFGPATLAATLLYQKQHGLTVDGVVGPASWGSVSSPGYVPIVKGFTPESELLAVFDSNGKQVGRLRKDVAPSYNKMVIDAAKEGIRLVPTSSVDTYRGPAVYKTAEAKRKIALGIMAKPGHSNHNLGKAVDFDLSKPGVFKWLVDNAEKYGFSNIERHKDEPWHWVHNYGKP